LSDGGNGKRPQDCLPAWFDRSHRLRLAEGKMAKKANDLQDLVQEIEDLIAELARLENPQIEGLANRAEQSIGEATGRIAEQSGPPRAP
jgi:ElaB/YqjD/DUF883 family membrane-anchored ribosome-binding protein